MRKVTLGRTGIEATKVAMGCLPIQRISKEEASILVRIAYDEGINFFDTAHVYTDSEEKMGMAFKGINRDSYYIASKAMTNDYKEAIKQIDQSLKSLGTDYIDIYQWHNPKNPQGAENDENSTYRALVDAKKAGKIRFIGITNHKLDNAIYAAESGLYDTVQYPFSMLSSSEEINLTKLCKKNNVGFLAMKAMCGGLLEDGVAPYAFMNTMENVVPLWGVQKESELRQFLELEKNPPVFDEKMVSLIEKTKEDLGNEFCRGCGYCMPCPKGIELNNIMRIEFFVKRNDPKKYLSEEWKAKVEKVNECIKCGKCISKCPYGLNIPERIKNQYEAYNELYVQYHNGEELKFRKH